MSFSLRLLVTISILGGIAHADEPFPVAGYGDGNFFIRDPKDWIVIYPKGRLHVDWYNFLNRGDPPAGVDPNSAKDPRPRDTIFVRRARIELQGTVMRHFDFHIAGEYATTPATGATGILADCYIIVDYFTWLKAQVGQFDAPFTLENRTSDKYFDFIERSMAVRAFGVPLNKEVGGMLFGWAPKQIAYYSIGVFNGDGQSFKNQDNNAAVMGRVFVAPIAWIPAAAREPWLQDIWVGGSFWWQKNLNLGGPVAGNTTGAAQNDLPTMTTQGGVTFFNTNYNNGVDSNNNAIRSHLVPFGTTMKWAVEANVPVWRKVGLRFEFVNQDIDLAQYNDTNPMNAAIVRSAAIRGGHLGGYGMYLQAHVWILGDVRFLETPGLEPAPRLHKLTQRIPRWGLMVAAKYERLSFDITGLPAGDPAGGHYQIQAFELGVNAWGTKHIRLSANYILNWFDGDSKQLNGNFFAHRGEHELIFRLGLAL
jgi:hypothetical protein